MKVPNNENICQDLP